jgi:ferredoxin
MANPKKRVPENVPGDFFVDSTCIDCDACRQIAPAVFGEAAETSFVKAQPVASADRRRALQALLACPQLDGFGHVLLRLRDCPFSDTRG